MKVVYIIFFLILLNFIWCDGVVEQTDNADCTLPDQSQCPAPCRMGCFRDLTINGNYTVPNFDVFVEGLIRADVLSVTNPEECRNIPQSIFVNKFGQQQIDIMIEQAKQFCRNRLLFDTSGRYGIGEFKLVNPIGEADLTGLIEYLEVGYGRTLWPENQNQRIFNFYLSAPPSPDFQLVSTEIYIREYIENVGENWILVQTSPLKHNITKFMKKKKPGQKFDIKIPRKTIKKILKNPHNKQYRRSTNKNVRKLRVSPI